MFGLGKARAFNEIHHAHRGVAELLTGRTGRFKIFTALFRVLDQVLTGVAFHKREIQPPPGQPYDRHPDQLLLEEELQKRCTVVEHPLHGEDVDPALMVAQHQVPAFPLELFVAVDGPFRALGKFHPAGVAGNPGFGDPDNNFGAQNPETGVGNNQLQYRRDVEKQAPEQGIQPQEDGTDDADNGSWQEAEHGGPVVGFLRWLNDTNGWQVWAVA